MGDIRSQLKQAALVCDHIALRHTHSEGDCSQFTETWRDIDVLKQTGVIVDAPDPFYDATKHPWLSTYPEHILTDPQQGIRNFIVRKIIVPGQPVPFGPYESTDHYKERYFSDAAEVYSRVVAAQLQEMGARAVPLLSQLFRAHLVSSVESSEAVRIILDQFPLPAADTPLEAILDWRADPDAKQQFARLRVWINKNVRQKLSPAELQDEIESSLAEYASYMRLHHKKISRGRFELICSAIAEVLEALPKIKLSPLLDVAFHTERSNLALSEVEAKAPGRELAYVLRAREEFGG
jgi:hypothetical protein